MKTRIRFMNGDDIVINDVALFKMDDEFYILRSPETKPKKVVEVPKTNVLFFETTVE